jgi:hypothetical protein
MDIVRKDDGTLVIPVEPGRATEDDGDDAAPAPAGPTTREIHPGEGGYDEALAEWDLQQDPDRQPAVSTATGRDEAMHLVHEVSESPDHAVGPALEAIADPEASAEALRHVLVGGKPSVEDFAKAVADAEGGEPLAPHEATKIIGEILSEID